jgi:hypothetical protein
VNEMTAGKNIETIVSSCMMLREGRGEPCLQNEVLKEPPLHLRGWSGLPCDTPQVEGYSTALRSMRLRRTFPAPLLHLLLTCPRLHRPSNGQSSVCSCASSRMKAHARSKQRAVGGMPHLLPKDRAAVRRSRVLLVSSLHECATFCNTESNLDAAPVRQRRQAMTPRPAQRRQRSRPKLCACCCTALQQRGRLAS